MGAFGALERNRYRPFQPAFYPARFYRWETVRRALPTHLLIGHIDHLTGFTALKLTTALTAASTSGTRGSRGLHINVI